MPPKIAPLSQGTKSSQGTPSSTTQPATTITYTAIIDHIANLYGFAKNSTMMQIIAQQRWNYPMLPNLQWTKLVILRCSRVMEPIGLYQ
jgi:hypothetical protein